MPEQKPSIGRIVHYRSFGTPNGEYVPECCAAIVTAVDEYQPGEGFVGHVGLCVLNPTGQFFNQQVLQDETNKCGGTWHWPERV